MLLQLLHELHGEYHRNARITEVRMYHHYSQVQNRIPKIFLLLLSTISSMTMASRLYYTSAILFYTATASARASSSPIASLSTLASSSGFVGSNFIQKNHHKHKQFFSTSKIMSTTSSYKRAKLSHLTPSTKTIGTHSGTL